MILPRNVLYAWIFAKPFTTPFVTETANPLAVKETVCIIQHSPAGFGWPGPRTDHTVQEPWTRSHQRSCREPEQQATPSRERLAELAIGHASGSDTTWPSSFGAKFGSGSGELHPPTWVMGPRPSLDVPARLLD